MNTDVSVKALEEHEIQVSANDVYWQPGTWSTALKLVNTEECVAFTKIAAWMTQQQKTCNPVMEQWQQGYSTLYVPFLSL